MPTPRGTPRSASDSIVGRIAAARMKAKKRSAASSFSCQSASAATTIPPATSVASAARWAVSFTPPAFPVRAVLKRALGLGRPTCP